MYLRAILCTFQISVDFYYVPVGGRGGGRGGKDTGTEDTISQFGRRNQMSSSNILSIHGLKKEHQFQDSNRDI